MSARLWLMALFLLAGGPAAAAPLSGQDPDWPCQQRFVPTLSAAALWSGAATAGASDWRKEPKVAALVAKIAPREVSDADGSAAIAAFVKPLTAAQRQRLIPLVFAGLVEETNAERGALLGRLKDFGARQRNLSALVGKLSAEHDAIPADAQGDDARRREDLAQRLLYTTQAFESMQRTIRYACETPTALEARLGTYARALQAALK